MESSEYEQMYRLEDRHWYFAGKRGLVVSLLGTYLSKLNPLVLDAGCGTGRTLAELALRYDVVGMEPFAGALSFAARRGRTRLVQGSLEQAPFVDGAFDAVTALDVLEHCDDDRKALCEISRILTAEGLLIITVPAFKWLWSAHDEALHHRRRYTKAGLLLLLEQCGFVVSKISYFNFFMFPVVAITRLVGKVLNRAALGADTDSMPSQLLNSSMNSLQRLERTIIGFSGFPFGVSLVCVARKR